MLARLQRFITLGLLAAALLWAAWFIHIDRPGWAAAGALLIIFGYAIFLGLEFVFLYFVHGDDPTPRATVPQLLHAWIGEVLTAPQVFCWRQPFRSTLVPDHVPAASTQRGVVLVHGFVCNRGLWNPWMQRLMPRGTPFIAVNLEPVFGSISHYADIIESAVARLEAATGRAPLLVGHSMGGLAIRAWAAAHGGEARAHRIITIGSPHRGTWLGRFSTTANGHEMRLASPWQVALGARESATLSQRFICFYSHCDNIVFPASTATLPGADNRHVPGVAHVDLVNQPVVFEALLAAL
ncbi:triacylglycerol lipase [Rhizobacter sp. OV335]|uniref:esterase/lipase family protein n=1 Tax=Rhizobacter sp. OV335 TaxID=1500264 RepID=UPI0009207880|nr:alpha/beta fold hydrolase [Rhizobacter sp. OV335]SHL91888.1 Triacylglycerol esterase/lipase EstA, alpha/beta hydrolase fold [Rhizobacter sp. OV335]